MTIAYDVMLMQQLVAACQSANDELLKAQALVLEVQSHGDWTCKEKNAIDDLMRECKKRIQALCENEQGFLGAIKQVAEELTDAEKNVSLLFGGVEGLLGKILAIPVKIVTFLGQSILDRLGIGTNTNTIDVNGPNIAPSIIPDRIVAVDDWTRCRRQWEEERRQNWEQNQRRILEEEIRVIPITSVSDIISPWKNNT